MVHIATASLSGSGSSDGLSLSFAVSSSLMHWGWFGALDGSCKYVLRNPRNPPTAYYCCLEPHTLRSPTSPPPPPQVRCASSTQFCSVARQDQLGGHSGASSGGICRICCLLDHCVVDGSLPPVKQLCNVFWDSWAAKRLMVTGQGWTMLDS